MRVPSLVEGEAVATHYNSGVPLGGIGTGRIEIFPDGTFRNLSINNNWDAPIEQVPASFFALRAEVEGRVVTRVLSTCRAHGLEGVERIDYHGAFPHARLTYIDGELPVDVRLRAFGPVIPHNYKDSSLPVALFVFDVTNTSSAPAEVSVAFSWQNVINCGGWIMGTWAKVDLPPDLQKERGKCHTWHDVTGNFQRPVRTGERSGLVFDSQRTDPVISYGNHTLLADSAAGFETSHLVSWNAGGDGRDFTEPFAETGVLPRGEHGAKGATGHYEPAGAVAISGRLAAGESREVAFALAWHMPGLYAWNLPEKGLHYGHYHQNHFDDSTAVARYALDNRARLFESSSELHRLLAKSNLPEWIVEKLTNDMFPVVSNTWYTKDGRFSVSEAPSHMAGCMGTIDQRTASHTIYTTFWPRLDRKELEMFRATQDENGAIAHDVGWGDLESLNKGSRWVDLPSSYILEAYHHYLWSGDEAFIKGFYDSMKAAAKCQMTAKADPDGDGLPDAEGGTTYDAYFWHGANSFVGTLWMAALSAMEKLAERFHDEEFAAVCRAAFGKAKKSMTDRLWMGDYFRLFNGEAVSGRTDDSICSGQLAGQWLAYLLGLGELFPNDVIQKCVRKMYDHCLRKVEYGVADVIDPAGNIRKANHGWTCSWVPYVQAYMATNAFYCGLEEVGLETFKRCRDIVYERDGRPWEAYLAYDVHTGKADWGRWYMTHPASWAVFWAIEGFGLSIPDGKLTLAPNLPPDMMSLSAPVFATTFWGWLDYDRSEAGRVKLQFSVDKTVGEDYTRVTRFETAAPRGRTVTGATLRADAKVVKQFVFDKAAGTVTFNCDLPLRPGAKLVVEARYA